MHHPSGDLHRDQAEAAESGWAYITRVGGPPVQAFQDLEQQGQVVLRERATPEVKSPTADPPYRSPPTAPADAEVRPAAEV